MGRLRSLLRDFAIPLVAALLALWFQLRENRKKDEKDLQDRAYLERKAHQDRAYEIWANLVPQFLRNVEKLYLPLAGDLQQLLMKLNVQPTYDAEDSRERFYYLLRFLRRMRQIAEQIGGFNFKNREGERVVAYAWKVFQNRALERLTPYSVARCLDAIDVRESRATFDGRFKGTSATALELTSLEQRVAGWLAREQEDTLRFDYQGPLLETMFVTLSFELNRLFEGWYGSAEEFPVDKLRNLRNILHDQDEEDLCGAIDAYIKQG